VLAVSEWVFTRAGPFADIRIRFLHRLTGFLSARRATSTTLWTRAAAGLEVPTGLALIVGLNAFSSVPSDLNAAGEATGRVSGFVMLYLAVGFSGVVE
jgi:hypothetical protein